MIPEHHWTMSLRGVQGTGKTKLASAICGALSQIEDMPVRVVCMRSKVETTIPFYEKSCEEFRHYKGLTYGMFKRMRNTICVIEDAPLIMRTERRAQVVESLVTALSRAKKIFVIITSQRPQKLPTSLTTYLDVKGKDYFYRFVEGRNATPWKVWTTSSKVDKGVLEAFFEALYHGVEGEEIGKGIGRPVEKESLRQKCFDLFEKGHSASEVANKHFPKKYHHVYEYYSQFKKRKIKERGEET